uniref:Uncharacterized protein n=1 Tax=Brassica oleracea TaxID=3712 RepID=A0A3P6AKE4_BRAOL|nr:unnamed protein product [Brassica oleracea]
MTISALASSLSLLPSRFLTRKVSRDTVSGLLKSTSLASSVITTSLSLLVTAVRMIIVCLFMSSC